MQQGLNMEARETKAPKAAIGANQRALLVTAVTRVAARPGGDSFTRLLLRRLDAAFDEVEREEQVLEAMLPEVSVMTDSATTQLIWNAKARASALSEFGALTAADIEEIRGVESKNPHATPSRWVKENRVFAVDTPGGRIFPAFQFSAGEPKPVIRMVLVALNHQLRGWEILTWFTGSSGYLDGDRPVDLLDKAPEEVVAAAAYQASLSED
jgi:hypothetical protein